MGLLEISTRRIREAAAKLPKPGADGKLEKPDSAIDAGLRKSAESHATGDEIIIGTSQLLDRINELAPEPKPAEPVSAETKTKAEPPKSTAKAPDPKLEPPKPE
jgi:hypothetical protein